VRLTLADDALLFREGMARILVEAGFEVAGQARDGAELLALVHRDPPDAAIIDIRMPPSHTSEGIEAAAEIRRIAPDVGLLLLSQHLDTHHAVRLMTEFQRGVGYLLKDRVSDLAAFAGDVRRVAGGACVIDPELVARLLARKRDRDPLAALTDRERRVLALMAQGRSNSALSAELCLSAKTVEAHVRSIFMKLDLAPDAADHRRVLAVLAFLRSVGPPG
jgi:DNA-binding NarL/FixJ family response regulator